MILAIMMITTMMMTIIFAGLPTDVGYLPGVS